MRGKWPLPTKEVILENAAVSVSAADSETDLIPLFSAASLANNGEDLFRYHVNVPPMSDIQTFQTYIGNKTTQSSEIVYKIYSRRLQKLVGCASLMNIRPEHGVVEIGSIWYAKEAQRTEINTNAMYLLFCYVFDTLSYRRLEWKCNEENEASKRAALRLGFQFEGLFRQHFVSHGKNRDTAWYSIIDSEWPDKKRQLESKLKY